MSKRRQISKVVNSPQTASVEPTKRSEIYRRRHGYFMLHYCWPFFHPPSGDASVADNDRSDRYIRGCQRSQWPDLDVDIVGLFTLVSEPVAKIVLCVNVR